AAFSCPQRPCKLLIIRGAPKKKLFHHQWHGAPASPQAACRSTQIAVTPTDWAIKLVKSKPKPFHPWVPEQTLLLPPSPVDWLPAHHLVFFMLELPSELDFEAFLAPSSHKEGSQGRERG
ncbi:MAG: hypothetical protein WCH37_09650, partial [Synechococcaceae cyanobacterium ELA182]